MLQKYIFTGLTVTMLLGAFYILFFSTNSHLYGVTCGYESQMSRCDAENNGWDPRSIEDFLCIPDWDAEKRTYQIVLDGKFSEIDTQIENYLDQLQQWKSRFYGWWETYLDGYDEITQKLWKNGEYWEKYRELCSASNTEGIIQTTLACLGWEGTISNSSSFFQESSCMELVEVKLTVYRDVADTIVYLNKAYVVSDRQTSYLWTQTDTYSWLIDSFTYNLWLMYKIVQKYQSRNSFNDGPS